MPLADARRALRLLLSEGEVLLGQMDTLQAMDERARRDSVMVPPKHVMQNSVRSIASRAVELVELLASAETDESGRVR